MIVVVVALAVGVLAGLLVLWRAQPREAGAVAAPPRSAALTGSPGAVPWASGGVSTTVATRSATTPAASVVVHVAGLVASPGVVTLPPGARVADAVARAGGPRRGADLGTVNLARLLVDGEQIVVLDSGAPRPAGAPVGAAGGPGGSAGPVDLNAATQDQLEALPGVGPVLAGRILAWRSEHGRFSTVDELREVSGIGEKLFAQISPRVRV